MSQEVGNERIAQGDSPGAHPGSDPVPPIHEEAGQVTLDKLVNTTKRLETTGHLVVVVIVIFAAVGLRIDRAIDVPTVSSVLIGALGYATGLTAGRVQNGKH